MNYIQYDDTIRRVTKFTTVRDGFHLLDLNKAQYGRMDVGVEENTTLHSKCEIII
jgi:hypothetical protein